MTDSSHSDYVVRNGNEYHLTAGRDLFDHEHTARVDFAALSSKWGSALEALIKLWLGVRRTQVAAGLDQIRRAVDNRDLGALAHIRFPADVGAALLREQFHTFARVAGAEAQAELERQGIDRVIAHLDPGLLDARAAAVADLLGQTLATAMGNKAVQLAGPVALGDDVAGSVEDYVAGLSDQYLRDQIGGALTAVQNAARMTVFDAAPPGNIYASELLDKNTCGPCGEIDGTNFDSMLAAHLAYPTGGYRYCRGGPRCRGTLVYVSAREVPATVS